MAEYNGNNIYLTIDGADVKARFRTVDMTRNVGDENTSSGTGNWEKHAAKLESISMNVVLIYDDVDAANDLLALKGTNAILAVVYGPEGNTAGKPCHDQSFKLNSMSGPSTSHDKAAVMIEMAMISTGAPTKNIYDGDTF